MYKFGICNYDFDVLEPKVESLQIFDTYEEAYIHYVDNCIAGANGNPDKTEWLVWIKGNRIIQFDRFTTLTKCRRVKIDKI